MEAGLPTWTQTDTALTQTVTALSQALRFAVTLSQDFRRDIHTHASPPAPAPARGAQAAGEEASPLDGVGEPGYERAIFADAWARYLLPPYPQDAATSATSLQGAARESEPEAQDVADRPRVAVREPLHV